MKPSSSFNEIVFSEPGAGMSFDISGKELVASHVNAGTKSEAEMKQGTLRCFVGNVRAPRDRGDNSR
ncbi:hypothetical protein RY831_04110 [Noviherbaspirillum sp. CPCC 100848]|jgi:hypothetical protein|uniref:Uncharacterized protein n=1 Tax=Noviherbaspirillum album TaxID=3080276 RepID=A0ABU6J470_9BURK|nr:hypothetical protein [Noviherbaspirillum sp. CPCC 100848]MEC4718320.1 hypothetical protein [Noviherbaspirillum sp. CPCC 100848]